MEISNRCRERHALKIWIPACFVCLVAAAIVACCISTQETQALPGTPPAVLVDYHRVGGIPGYDDRLVIFDNGAAIVSSRMASHEIRLNQTDLDQISSIFTNAQFSMLESNYTAQLGTDLVHYIITYRGKTVNTEDSATPPQLQQVIDVLNRIIATGDGLTQQVNPLGNVPVSIP